MRSASGPQGNGHTDCGGGELPSVGPGTNPGTGPEQAGSPASLGPLPAKDPSKGTAEVLVEDGVDDRIQGAVAVANPEEELEEAMRHLAVLWADGPKAVAEEERKPADHKNANDHGQHKGEPFLPAQLCPSAPPLATGHTHILAQKHLATKRGQHPGSLRLLQGWVAYRGRRCWQCLGLTFFHLLSILFSSLLCSCPTSPLLLALA